MRTGWRTGARCKSSLGSAGRGRQARNVKTSSILGRRREIAIVGIKAAHSAIFLGLLASLLVFAQRGVARRSDRLAAITGSVVAVEALVFCGNGRRCPLTDAVESLGAAKGSVTDIFLPSFIASRIFTVTAPLFGLSLAMHARNLMRRARA